MKSQLVACGCLAICGALAATSQLSARPDAEPSLQSPAQTMERGAPTPLRTVRIASGLTQPTFVGAPESDFERLFIVEKTGRIKIYQDGSVLGTPYINLSSRLTASGFEQGLLGLAFHPDFENNGYFYVNYTNNFGNSVIARYTANGDPLTSNTADFNSEQIVLTVNQPFTNHNCGWLDFGPDGFLYVPFGDGGSGNDPGNRAQNLNTLLGKMLRIDVDADDFPGDANRNYAIPGDNPFVGQAGLDEIWAYGLRNPFRNAFDRETGDLWIADVGQNAREEVNFQPADSNGGENYGWRCKEGFLCTGLSGCNCSSPALTDPIHDYSHTGAICSITGGYVYRGCNIPDLQGTYFFADYCSNQIWSLRYDGANVFDFQERTSEFVPDVGGISFITSFGQDAYGELYICDQGGEVFKIEADTPTGFVGPDCNNNGAADACDILDGTSADDNNNGIPDECEPAPCPWDLSGDGEVGSADLAALLGSWNAPFGSEDLAALLGSWGPCPN